MSKRILVETNVNYSLTITVDSDGSVVAATRGKLLVYYLGKTLTASPVSIK